MTRLRPMLSLVLLLACWSNPKPSPDDLRVDAARFVTRQYAHSRLVRWNVRASAAARDCDVLFVETSVIMEDSMIEALHYGGGRYDVIDGGVDRFYRARSFRGVAYRDATERLWTYGGVTAEEARTLRRCD